MQAQTSKANNGLNSFLVGLGLQHKRIVLYSGNFGKTHDIRTIVEAARLMVAKQDIHFLLIGEGEQKPMIEELIAVYKLKNVTLMRYTDSHVFPSSIASGEIAIVTLDAAAQNVSTPSKTYNSMAAGSAIVGLASTESELADLITKHDMGVVVPPGDVHGLAATIERLFEDDIQLNSYRQNARTASHGYTPRNAQRYVQAIAPTTD
jgi:glycosyltransferase involved in cell wall biosynthesis